MKTCLLPVTAHDSRLFTRRYPFAIRAHVLDANVRLKVPAYAHAVEGAPDEEGRDEEEDRGQNVVERVVAAAARDRERQLDREQAEERRELDARVHRHRR